MASKRPEPLTDRLLMNDAMVNLNIRRRTIPTLDGRFPLLYFDGSTMNKFKYPSKPMEAIFCRNPNMTQSCSTSHVFELRSNNTSFVESSMHEPDCVEAFRPYEESFGMKTMIRMDSYTDRVVAASEHLCGSDKCANAALVSMKDDYGQEGTSVSIDRQKG
jgi:hypothetical protein